MKRIISITLKVPSNTQFFPQWFDGHKWQFYFFYESDSPYICVKRFNSQAEAQEWFKSPEEYFKDLNLFVVEEFS